MNYHSDQWIMDRVREHYNEALESFPEDRIVCLCLQGSQNYGLDCLKSDVDTKLIVTPTFIDIALNKNPISSTHIRVNDEHTDWKDIRLYMQTFRKQNLNFLEVLFTPYRIVNPTYAEQWQRLIDNREDIAHYNPIQAIKSMAGLARTKYKNMEHTSPAALPFIEKFQYVPKELHHLLRIEEYIYRYWNGESYEDCLKSQHPEHLKEVKLGKYNLEEAREQANDAIEHIDLMRDDVLKNDWSINTDIDLLLNDVQYEIMKTSIKKEINI